MKTLISFALLASLSTAACKRDAANTDVVATAASAKAGDISCDAVIANIGSFTKVDADGKKMFAGICANEPQQVRACMLAAKSTKDLDVCDPHPLAKQAPAAATKAVDVGEIDLSTADPAWKGWVVTGPKDAKVMADGFHGARIAENGLDAFDVAFSPKKTKMADVKKGVEAGGKLTPGAKTTYAVDTKDKLEWTTEIGGAKAWHFRWNVKTSGKDVSCSDGAMGASSEAQLAQFKSACTSLRKK